MATVTAAKKPQKRSSLAGLLDKKEKAELDKVLSAAEQAYRSPDMRALLFMIANSYHKFTGQYLVETDFEMLPDTLFNAPFVLVAHDKFQAGVTDPKFIYANRAALTLWEATWDEMIGLPSRKSAPDVAATQQERQGLLAKADDSGVIKDYAGWRVSLKGKNFRIKGVTLFNIEDADGDKLGQAAVFNSYDLENGQEVKVQGYEDALAAATAAAAATKTPSIEDVAEAEAGAQKWGAYVRDLKERQGLTNQSPEVQEAVKNMQMWKAQAAALQKRMEEGMAAARAAFDDDD